MFKGSPQLWSQIKHTTNNFNNYKCLTRGLKRAISKIKAEYDNNYLTNPDNFDEIKANIINRKGVGNIEQVNELINKFNQTKDNVIRENLQKELQIALKSIPNKTHPDVIKYGNKPVEIDSIGSKRNFDFKPKSCDDLCKKLNILRTNDLGNFNGTRSYYLMNDLAELVSTSTLSVKKLNIFHLQEQALIRYTIEKLNLHGFELISVPEMVPPEVIENCGMNTTGERTQVC